MHIYGRTIHLGDTDATGVIYFAKMQNIALEAFEDYLTCVSLDLASILKEKKFLFPIVHVDANYMQPLFVGDKVKAHLKLQRIGNSSFTFITELFKNRCLVGTVQITHVTVLFGTKKSTDIPSHLKLHLEKL